MKHITTEEWTKTLETLCFSECREEKNSSGVRRYIREDCREGGDQFEKWLTRQPVDRLLRVLSKLEQ